MISSSNMLTASRSRLSFVRVYSGTLSTGTSVLNSTKGQKERLLVGVGLEGGVLLGQLHQGDAHLLLARLGLGLDGHPDHRLGELHRRRAEVTITPPRQSGGKGQYGHVKIKLEPNESGKGYEFINATVGGSIRR